MPDDVNNTFAITNCGCTAKYCIECIKKMDKQCCCVCKRSFEKEVDVIINEKNEKNKTCTSINISESFRKDNIICGKKGSGKSWITKELLKNISSTPVGVVMSPNK